jgi:hypothetical protein
MASQACAGDDPFATSVASVHLPANAGFVKTQIALAGGASCDEVAPPPKAARISAAPRRAVAPPR